MQIQLKQREIEDALRGYILKQGITLKGRTLEISFISGRKENGLTADLCIEDSPIPGFSEEEPEGEHKEGEDDPAYQQAAAPVPVEPTDAELEQLTAPTEPVKATSTPVFEQAPAPEVTEDEPVKAGISLFN